MSLLVDSRFYHASKVRHIGGGVGLLVSSQFKFENISISAMPSFEAMCGRISDGKISLTMQTYTGL